MNDIHGPPEAIQNIVAVLGLRETGTVEKQVYEVDCNITSTLPSLSFAINDRLYHIPPQSYIRRMFTGLVFKTEICYVALLANSGSVSDWILGTNFLENFQSIYDVNMRRVALVPITPTATQLP